MRHRNVYTRRRSVRDTPFEFRTVRKRFCSAQNVGPGKAIREYPHHAIEVIHQWLFGLTLPPPPQEGEILSLTTTHGFFLEMGRFDLCEDGRRPACTLPGKEIWI